MHESLGYHRVAAERTQALEEALSRTEEEKQGLLDDLERTETRLKRFQYESNESSSLSAMRSGTRNTRGSTVGGTQTPPERSWRVSEEEEGEWPVPRRADSRVTGGGGRVSRARHTPTDIGHQYYEEYAMYSDDEDDTDDHFDPFTARDSNRRHRTGRVGGGAIGSREHQYQHEIQRDGYRRGSAVDSSGGRRYRAEAKAEFISNFDSNPHNWRRGEGVGTYSNNSTGQRQDRKDERGDKVSDAGFSTLKYPSTSTASFLQAVETVSQHDIESFYGVYSDDELSRMTSALSIVSSKVEEARRLSIQRKEKDLADSKLSSEENSLCCICRDATKTILLLPCRHLCLCEDCSVALQQRRGPCPVCREAVRDTLKVFA